MKVAAMNVTFMSIQYRHKHAMLSASMMKVAQVINHSLLHYGSKFTLHKLGHQFRSSAQMTTVLRV